MIRNYLKVAWRNLRKNKMFTLINILGLSVSLCCFLLIVLYVNNELSFDRYNTNVDRIYRIQSDIRFGGNEARLAVTSDMMGQLVKKDYPEIENYTRIYASGGSKLVRKGNEFIEEDNVAHVDSTFFEIFTLPAIKGNTRSALVEPNTVAITKSTALNYFGNTDDIGRICQLNDKS